MGRYGWWLLKAAILLGTTGCFAQMQQNAASQGTQESLAMCSSPKEDGKPRTAPELAALGDSLRDAGMQAQAAGAMGGGDSDLSAAASCYGRALQLAPESYAANLGLGVSYLARARTIQNKNDSRRRHYLAAAKRMVGYAYMMRHGGYEALYYLAEAAVLDEDWSRARVYLEPLKRAGYKLGPVYALLGFIAEEQHDNTQAATLYEMAMNAGWPAETVDHVSRKVEEVR
jgi:hypothetical protein